MPRCITNELESILYSGKLSFAKFGNEFEQSIKAYIGDENVLTISSYNHALLIVLSTLGLKQGDAILASPVSCLASNQPFAVKGVKVTWVDVEPSTGAMCVEDVKKKITKNTKAIFHNHFAGYLGYINEINAIGREYGIPVVDDYIEAFGSELDNKKAGNLGSDISVFSFQTVRLPNTIDGGAIVFKNKELMEKARLVRDYGIDRTIFRDNLGEISKECDIKIEGYAGLMSEINSLLGIRQMGDIIDLINKQRENAKVWDKLILSANGIRTISKTPDTNPNYWVYGTLADNKIETIKKFRQAGFYATGIHINNNIYSVFENNTELRGVNEFMNHFVAIPSGWWVNKEEIKL